MSATKTLVDFAVNSDFEDLPESVIEKAKILVMDAVGCAIAGSSTEIAEIAIKLVTKLGGSTESTVIGTNFQTNCTQASFANSISVNAWDYDDVSPTGHPGSTIIPAALAIAERTQKSGKELLTAVVLGYEVCERVGAAIRATYKRRDMVFGIGTHQTFGSVTAAGKLLKLTTDEMLDAFGIAGAFSPLPHEGKFGYPHVAFVKDNVAMATQAGVYAALLAQDGFVGCKTILDGDKGYWIMAGSDRCDFDELADVKGFRILNVSVKPYPSCRWTHTTLEAVSDIIRENGVEARDIENILVRTISPVAESKDINFVNYGPKNSADAQFSVPYPLAMIVHGVPKSEWHLKDNLNNPIYLKTEMKIKIEKDANAQKVWEEQKSLSDVVPTTVRITTKKGEFTRHCEVSKGSPQRPLTYSEVEQKFIELVSKRMGFERGSEIIETLKRIEQLDDISKLTKKLQLVST